MRCIQLLTDNRKATHAFIHPHVVHSFKTSNRNYCNQSLSWRKMDQEQCDAEDPRAHSGSTWWFEAIQHICKTWCAARAHPGHTDSMTQAGACPQGREGKDKTEMHVTFLWRRRPRMNFWFRSSGRFCFKNRENMEEVEKKRKQLGWGVCVCVWGGRQHIAQIFLKKNNIKMFQHKVFNDKIIHTFYFLMISTWNIRQKIKSTEIK